MKLIDVGEIMKQARRDCGICCEKIERIITTSTSNLVGAVPAVRCKDCEYGEQADEFSYICNNGAWVHLFCRADDFCSRGIRRGKNEQVDQR